jgi:hypothetical protein
MADARHEQTLAHLRLLASLPGYWELRALHRAGANHMTPRGSFWIGRARSCYGRSIEGKTKAAVPAVTCCFVDLDLGGESIDEALVALTSGRTPAPSFIVHSGYGLHAVWLLREPSRDKAQWRQIQRAIVR